MPFIIWGPKIEVGIELIDEQHHRLVDIINNLYDAVQGNYAAEAIVGIFIELVEYTHFHFRAEEELMRKYDLDEKRYLNQIQQHKIFTDQIEEYLNEYMEGKSDGEEAEVSIDVLIYLRDWLIAHIVHTDMRDLSVIKANMHK